MLAVIAKLNVIAGKEEEFEAGHAGLGRQCQRQ